MPDEAHALVLHLGGREIRMANPFSAVPTAYRVYAKDRWWYANCARDALGISAAHRPGPRREAASYQRTSGGTTSDSPELVRLTPAGVDLIDQAMALHATAELELVNSLSAKQRDQLAGSLRALLFTLEPERHRTKTANATSPDGETRAFFRDPDGHLFEISELT